MTVNSSHGTQSQMAVDDQGGRKRRSNVIKVLSHRRLNIIVIAAAGAAGTLTLRSHQEWSGGTVALDAALAISVVLISSTYSRRISLRRWAPGLTLGLVSVMALAYPSTGSAAVTTPGPTGNQQQTWAPAGTGGWTRDFLENFDAPLNTNVWGRYRGRSSASTMSNWVPSNVYTSGGKLLINTINTNGVWTSGGVSSGVGAVRTQGQWLVRAKLDRAPGIGYVFLLYPAGGGWPPEIDIAEGTGGQTKTMSVLHYDSDNKQVKKYLPLDITQWHTYGVIMYGSTISFTVDGAVWFSFVNAGVPNVPMWFGMQTNAKPNDGVNWEWVTSATPKASKVAVDWVSHYSYSG